MPIKETTEPLTNNMKLNAWTLGLMSAGIVSLPAVVHADERTNSILTAISSTTISGYVDTSMQWNPGTGNQNLPVYSPNGAPSSKKADGFNLNVVSLTISKAPGEGDWAAGYNATLLFGPDAVGYNNSFGTSPNDFSLMDTYVELRAPIGNGLDFKLGTFSQPLGYEVYQTGNNPNYTRSYGYEIEPTQLTGLMIAYQFGSLISVNGGIANTWSAGVNNRAFPPEGNRAESWKTYFGSVTLTAPDSFGFLAGSTLSGGVVNGYNALIPSTLVGLSGTTETSFYVGGTLKTFWKALSVGAAFDYACLGPNTANGLPHSTGFQYAGAVYLLLQATEKLSFNTRVDYFSQSSYLAAPSGAGFGTLPAQSLAITETIQYDLWKNVITRLEFRWDHAVNGSDPWGGTVPSLDNEYLLALNLIYKF
jgi:hypothetical protein